MKRILIAALFLVSSFAFGQGGTVSQLRYGSTLPAACGASDGEVFYKTGSSAGIYECLTTNTWTMLGVTSGVASINSGTGAFTFTGGGVSCAGTTCTFSSSGGSGSLILVESHTASSSAELDFTSCISGTYDRYYVTGIDLLPASSASNLEFQVSTNGGSSWVTAGSSYGWAYHYTSSYSNNDGNYNSTNSSISTAILLANNLNNVTVGENFTLDLFNPAGTSLWKSVTYHTQYYTTDPGIYEAIGLGVYQTAGTAYNAFRILYSSGNIASGTVRCYGVAH